MRQTECMAFQTYLSRRIFFYEPNRQAVDMVQLFAALADPTRLRLLNLMNGREVCVCYFVEILKQGPAEDFPASCLPPSGGDCRGPT